jgi:hypothetical protein
MRPAGVPIGSKCECKKGEGREDLDLSHALSCKSTSERFMRHDALVEDIYRWLRRKGIHVVKEYYVSNDGNERLDLWVRVEGELMWCDVIVTDPACPSIVAAAAKKAGAAVEKAESSKRSRYRALAEEAEATLIPLAFETTGRRGESLENFLKEMQAASPEGQTLGWLKNQLAITLTKFNVALTRAAGRKAAGVRPGRRRLARQRPHLVPAWRRPRLL